MLKFANLGFKPAAAVKTAFMLFSLRNVESFTEIKLPLIIINKHIKNT